MSDISSGHPQLSHASINVFIPKEQDLELIELARIINSLGISSKVQKIADKSLEYYQITPENIGLIENELNGRIHELKTNLSALNNRLEKFGFIRRLFSKISGYADLKEERQKVQESLKVDFGLMNLVNDFNETLAEIQDKEAATIQAAWRGYKARAEFKQTREAIVKIQSAWRSYQTAQAAKLKGAATTIQAAWRGRKARAEFKQTRDAIVKIQSAWRLRNKAESVTFKETDTPDTGLDKFAFFPKLKELSEAIENSSSHQKIRFNAGRFQVEKQGLWRGVSRPDNTAHAIKELLIEIKKVRKDFNSHNLKDIIELMEALKEKLKNDEALQKLVIADLSLFMEETLVSAMESIKIKELPQRESDVQLLNIERMGKLKENPDVVAAIKEINKTIATRNNVVKEIKESERKYLKGREGETLGIIDFPIVIQKRIHSALEEPGEEVYISNLVGMQNKFRGLIRESENILAFLENGKIHDALNLIKERIELFIEYGIKYNEYRSVLDNPPGDIGRPSTLEQGALIAPIQRVVRYKLLIGELKQQYTKLIENYKSARELIEQVDPKNYQLIKLLKSYEQESQEGLGIVSQWDHQAYLFSKVFNFFLPKE